MKKIYSDKIIEKINSGKNIVLKKLEIIGDIDFTTIKKTRKARMADTIYKSIITNNIIFKDCIIKGAIKTFHVNDVRTYYTEFKNKVSFEGSKFVDEVSFRHAKFYDEVNFNNAQFSEVVIFNEAKFYEPANFENTYFFNQSSFNKTKFYNKADFSNSYFLNEVDFDNTRFFKLKETSSEVNVNRKLLVGDENSNKINT